MYAVSGLHPPGPAPNPRAMAGTPSSTPSPVIESKAQLVEHLEAGCKPREQFRIGTEHEKIGFFKDTLAPLPYDTGVRPLLEGLQRFDWQPVFEGEHLIALGREGASISLEPGGQFELSGAPLENVHQTCGEMHRHLREVREVADEIGAAFLDLAFRPVTKLEDVPVMPKGRYGIMQRYMPTVGTLGLEMMFRTCTVQANLDFSSEAHMAKMFRVSLALQPIATALFANSPFSDGAPNGFKSYRSHIWTDTDTARAGMLPFVFEDGFGFEQYIDYALDVPMYFIHRNRTYMDAAGHSFRDFMAGKSELLPGELPTLSDFDDHLSTIFPEVRLKTFLEMRGADTGPWKEVCALPAFWAGILYDDAALDAAWALVRDWTAEERQALRDAVPRHALQTPFRNTTVQHIAQDVLAISRDGLNARARLNAHGENETVFLQELEQIARTGRTEADQLLDMYHNEWDGDIRKVYEVAVY